MGYKAQESRIAFVDHRNIPGSQERGGAALYGSWDSPEKCDSAVALWLRLQGRP